MLSEYIGEDILDAVNESDIKIADESKFTAVNNAMKFDYIVEAEDSVKVDGINFPEWVVTVCLNEENEIVTVTETTEEETLSISGSLGDFFGSMGISKINGTLEEREAAARKETENFLDRIYNGSLSMMVSAFTEKEKLSKEEIDELYSILQKAEEAQK